MQPLGVGWNLKEFSDGVSVFETSEATKQSEKHQSDSVVTSFSGKIHVMQT